jgi:hypothetical protein
MYHGWFRLCLFAGGSAATAGEGGHPCTWPLTFWFKPVSAFGLLVLTTLISSSPELAMPSTLVPDRISARSRRAPSREVRPPSSGEDTLSQELRTAGLLRPHVLVGYRWSHIGLCPGSPVITDTSAASCRNPLRTGRESCPSSSSSLHERPSRDAAAFVRPSCTWICRWQLACNNSKLSAVSGPPRLRQMR